MGNQIYSYISKRGSNPFSGAIGRNSDGAVTVDLNRVLSTLGVSPARVQFLDSAVRSLGSNPTADRVRNYSQAYTAPGGGDAGNPTHEVWRLLGMGDAGYDALDSAIKSFGIREKGEQDAARIKQEGRDKTAQVLNTAGIASAQRANLAAAESAAADMGGSEGGTPDVVQGSNVVGGANIRAGGAENENARRRRNAFGGAGLSI